ncbi:hypothetical protein T492DRAFT_834921 [Pavlovales sp. CCMP2436]|nr:hypothetical protein T492DRAFT_834921 [Pavlovales sp. CCMP2436]
MANVFGRLLSDPPMTPLEVQLTTSTSTETRLSLDGSATPQNQTRDQKKVMVIKNPTSGSPGNLVLPFDQALYASPLAFVADLSLSNELSTPVHKSLAVQFSYTQAKPIAAGSVFVLGDSLKLQAETATDPKSSTYTMTLLLPTATSSNMSPIPFENVAQVAYFRGGVKKDGQNRIVAELLVTGSNSTVQYQRRYDITRFVDEQNTVTMPYDPNLKYTLFVNSSNQNIYRSVIRVCGSTISSGAYTGIISPISSLQVLSSSERNIVLSDFNQKYIQSSNSKDVNFEGIYAKAANRATMDVVNMVERLDSKVFATDHLSSIDVFTKDSPTFNNNISIQTSQDWNNADGWRVVSSSTFQNNPLFAANSAFDKRTDTYYASSEGTYTSAGVGAQHLTLEYPTAVRLASFRFAGSTRYPGTTAPTQWTISASNDTNFVNIENPFRKPTGLTTKPQPFR